MTERLMGMKSSSTWTAKGNNKYSKVERRPKAPTYKGPCATGRVKSKKGKQVRGGSGSSPYGGAAPGDPG
jgi:hypothetical protein